MNDIVGIISQVGFPIACCIYLIYTNGKNGEKHDEEIENNTKAINKLCVKLGVDADD